MSMDAVAAYLEKLSGERPGPEQPVRISSLQRAALHAWLTKQAIAFDTRSLVRGTFTLTALLDGAAGRETAALPSPAPQSFSQTPGGFGVGIDIERTAKLPQTSDYRTDPFYQANFSPDEIGYCICQPDVRLSFCGLWAAKEAVLKTMSGAKERMRMDSIVIRHDSEGRPSHPGGDLSISHDGDISVAVFVRHGQR